MRNLHKFIEDSHRLEALHLLWEWKKWEIEDSKDLIPVNVKQKSTSNSRNRRAKEIIHRTEKQLLQDRIKCINGILCKNAIKVDRCRSRQLSLETTTTMDKCTDFINKVRESRFIIIRDRHINTFNRLMGNKDKEVTAQPSANSNQSQAPNISNKCVVNLSILPLTLSQESLLSKGPNYAVALKPPI